MERPSPVRGRRRFGSALGILLLTSTACYTYQPVQVVSVGDEARARLSVEEAVRQSATTGEAVREIEGRVTAMTTERIDFDVVTVRSQSVLENFQFSTSYSLPRTEIEELSLKKLSAWRSLGVTALIGGAIYLILDATIVGGGGDDPGGSVDPADGIVRFRIAR